MRKLRIRPADSRTVAIRNEYPGAQGRYLESSKPGQWLGPLVIEGDFEVEEIDDTSYVRVKLEGGSRASWTYIDPSGSLQVDDLVKVPFGYANSPRIGTVVELGNPTNYDGPIKTVISKVVEEAL